MAKTVSQIYKELDKTGGYGADRKLLNSQLSALPNQYAAQAAGLDAKLAQANDNILQGARGRGLGFSGPPIGEQLEYAATEYAPALANLKTQSEQNRLGILQSLNSLTRDQRSQAQSIFDANRNFAEQRRQFNASLAAQRRASAASAGGYSYSLPNSDGSGGSKKSAGPKVPKELQGLYNQVFVRPNGGEWNDKALVSDYNATLKSAKYGNARDKQKILLYHSVRPDLFGNGVPAYALGNGGGLKF